MSGFEIVIVMGLIAIVVFTVLLLVRGRASLSTCPTYAYPATVVRKWWTRRSRAVVLHAVFQLDNGTQMQFSYVDGSLFVGQRRLLYYTVQPEDGHYIYRSFNPLPEEVPIYAYPARLVKVLPVKWDMKADFFGVFQFDNGYMTKLPILACQYQNPIVGERKILRYQVSGRKAYFVSFQ